MVFPVFILNLNAKTDSFFKISSPCRKKVSSIMTVNAYNALKWGKFVLSLQFIFVA